MNSTAKDAKTVALHVLDQRQGNYGASKYHD